MTYTVRNLMEDLEMCDPDSEVFVATQPDYPISLNVSGVFSEHYETVSEEIQEICRETEGLKPYDAESETIALQMWREDNPALANKVFILAPSSPHDHPYTPRRVWSD